MSTSDDPLLHRVRQGDRDALAEFIDDRRLQLLAFINRNTGASLKRKVEADDILQEVSSEAVRTLENTDLKDRDPFSWLCHLAEQRIVDAHRRYFGSQKRDANREVALDGGSSTASRAGLINLLIASMTSPSQAFSRNQKQMRMLEALSQLPEEQHTALRLRYLEGLSSKEVAQHLGKTDGAVRVMLTRAISRLQSLLGEPDPPTV